MEGCNGAGSHTTAHRPIRRDRDTDGLTVMRLIGDPARRLRHVPATRNLDTHTAGRSTRTNNDHSDTPIDILERGALDAGAAAASHPHGAGPHEPRPVGEGPDALGDLVVVGGLLVDADHLLVGCW